MKFQWGSNLVEFRGDPSLGFTQISLKAMERVLRKEKQGMLIEVNQVLNESSPVAFVSIDTKWQQVLDQYQQVFHAPKGLPPSRGMEHAITLKEGTNPVV